MKNRLVENKVIVVFVDAGSFNVLNPLMKHGKNLTFGKIIKGGACGSLTSTMPPVTPPAWASFATGVNPGKHSVYDFWNFHGNGISSVTSYSIRRETLWSMIGRSGGRVILINTPMSYPPRKVNGIMVSGLLTPRDDPCTHPENLSKELRREIPEYKVYARINPHRDRLGFLEEAYNLLKARCDASLHLMENYDWNLLICYFYYVDQIQHGFWKYMDTTHPAHDPDAPRSLKEAIPKAYKIVDESIRKIMRKMNNDATLIVMSDHGVGPVYKNVSWNNYLRKIGLLKIRRQGTIRLSFYRFLKALGVKQDQLYRGVKRVTDFRGSSSNETKAKEEPAYSKYLSRWVDWTQTQAYSAGHFGQIFVNRDASRSPKYESLISYLIRKLKELRDPESNETVVDKIFRRSQIYWGEYVNDAPDLTVVMRRMTYCGASIGNEFESNKMFETPSGSADHRMEGILIMYGENIKSGYVLEKCQIMDLTPTILYLMGLQIPSDIDGRVLAEAFRSSYIKKHHVKHRARVPIDRQQVEALSKEDEQRIIERLKALGYMQ